MTSKKYPIVRATQKSDTSSTCMHQLPPSYKICVCVWGEMGGGQTDPISVTQEPSYLQHYSYQRELITSTTIYIHQTAYKVIVRHNTPYIHQTAYKVIVRHNTPYIHQTAYKVIVRHNRATIANSQQKTNCQHYSLPSARKRQNTAKTRCKHPQKNPLKDKTRRPFYHKSLTQQPSTQKTVMLQKV